MSNFYGTIDGMGKTQATRRGSKATGLTTHAAGWKGAIRVSLTHSEATGNDEFMVELVPWQGSGGSAELLARGVLDATLEAEGLAIVATEIRPSRRSRSVGEA